jgi:CheY-like chemotaxis protein
MNVMQCYDGTSALRLAAEFKPQFVFLDLVMPGMDGATVARRLRELECTRDAKIIAVTSFGSPSFLQAASEAGFDDLIRKPAMAADLLRTLSL